jgi:hypothetical protein
MTPTPTTIASNLETLSTDDLARLAALVADTIAARQLQDAITTDLLTPAATAQRKNNKRRDHSAPWQETKEVDGHLYRYERWWENGKKRSKYLGKA